LIIYLKNKVKHLMENFVKKPDYEGFVLHIESYKILGVAYGINDLIRLSKVYNTPIPDKYKRRIKE